MSNAARMLKQVVAFGIPSSLIQPVDFTRWNGVKVHLVIGQAIHVDVERGIANCGDDYFEIERSEYMTLLLN